MSNFRELFQARLIEMNQLDDFIEEWHEGDSPLELHEYLGLTWGEYSLIFPNGYKALGRHLDRIKDGNN